VPASLSVRAMYERHGRRPPPGTSAAPHHLTPRLAIAGGSHRKPAWLPRMAAAGISSPFVSSPGFEAHRSQRMAAVFSGGGAADPAPPDRIRPARARQRACLLPASTQIRRRHGCCPLLRRRRRPVGPGSRTSEGARLPPPFPSPFPLFSTSMANSGI
jgi:hypothetical protein